MWLAFLIVAQPDDALTFYGWSDQHVKTDGDASHVTPFADAMNALEGTPYPQKIGGKVAKPSFVLGAGDITEWPTVASRDAYDKILKERLKIKAYDVLGNHDDGGEAPSKTMMDWAVKRHGALSYAFDEGGIRFVMVWSAFDAKKEPAQPISAEALDFIRKELARLSKGAPAIVVTHLCFEAITNRDAVVDALAGANVLAVLGGHYHFASVNAYRGIPFVQLPSPKSDKTEFTVIRISPNRLVAIPYDFKKKEWVAEPRKLLDVPIKR